MKETALLSVGIDIGTSTTSLVFSRLVVENRAGYFSVPSVEITDKQVVYKSQVHRTPLLNQSLIDGSRLTRLIEQEYRLAGVDVRQVETGAVIITGESARKENAALVLEEMSRFAGDFVVSTAGPDLESVIAGQGSGAQKFSEENGAVAVNLDIGGGTTNVVLFDSGEVKARGCLDIGGRQVTVDENGRISYVSPSAARVAEALGISVAEGDAADRHVLERLCRGFDHIIRQLLGAEEEDGLLEAVRTSGSDTFRLPENRPIRYVFFSGGVADCIYHPVRDFLAYGDIGVLLGNAVRSGGIFQTFRVIEPEETIRATVIGAGSYTTAISGSTIACWPGLLPMKNLPVLKLTEAEEARCWQGDDSFVAEKAGWFLRQNDCDAMVLAFTGRPDPDYEELKLFARSIAEGMNRALPETAALVVILRFDMAKALGQLLRRMSGRRPVLAVDEIRVEQNNFVDFGNPIMGGLVVLVVMKTLVFG